MKILLTNDDGYDAQGLRCLFDLLGLTDECYLVAPMDGRSCCSHGVSTTAEIDVYRKADRVWAITGTPADCVRVAIKHLRIEPDWVISGVNQGGNLGVDIHYSGTIAAAREATLLGRRAVAISQYMRRDIERDWATIAMRAAHVFRRLINEQIDGHEFLSVNLPAIADSQIELPIVHCLPEPEMLGFELEALDDTNSGETENCTRVIYRSNYQSRGRSPGRDVQTCFDGNVTVTKLTIKLGA